MGDTQPRDELLHLRDKPTPGLDGYFDILSQSRLYQPIFHERSDSEVLKARVQTFLARNNMVAEVISSGRYESYTNRQKKLRGECVIGVVDCIDGRLPAILIGGRSMIFWREMAGIPETKPSAFNLDDEIISASRLSSSVEDRGANGDPILEILIAHTSLSDPDHACGAMKLIDPNGEDRTATNLKLLEEKRRVITSAYNTAAIRSGNNPLETASITAVYDTDSMGMVFGYGSDSRIETKSMAQVLADEIYSETNITPGLLSSLFTVDDNSFDKEAMYNFEASLTIVCNHLMTKSNQFKMEAEKIIEMYPDLNDVQKQALLFTVARTISLQYISGLYGTDSGFYDNHGHPHHRFADHAEEVMSLSLHGAKVGDFDPQIQVFAASVSDIPAAVKHITTECSLMESNKADKPYLLFVSQPFTSKSIPESSLLRVKAELRGTTMNLHEDEQIQRLIGEGKLLIIPVLIDDSTREVIEVLNFNT